MVVVNVKADPSYIRSMIAEQLMAVVAQTVRFLLLNPETWLSGRITGEERAEVEAAVARLIEARADQLADGPCPLCQHEGPCAQDCPVEVARAVVVANGRQ